MLARVLTVVVLLGAYPIVKAMAALEELQRRFEWMDESDD